MILSRNIEKMSTIIRDIKTYLYQLPLKETLVDAMHGTHTCFELIIVTIRLDNGVIGTGYTYTGGRGGQAIKALLDNDLVPYLINQDGAKIQELYQAMIWHMHYVGRGGILSFAISAIDIALWDAHCRIIDKPLWQVVGGHADRCRTYHGGIDLNYSLSKLENSIEAKINEGFNAVKIKIGQPELKDDIKRISTIRELIGHDRFFMIDANYSMTIDQAVTACDAFKEFDILWFEEPIDPDNFKGYGYLADNIDIPLAMGENLHTIYDFNLAFDKAKLSYIQPDASNCGGITGWLEVAKKAKEQHIEICSHGMQELHVSLVASQSHAGWVEMHSFPIYEYIKEPLIMENHLLIVPSVSGTGVEFNWQKLELEKI